MTTGQAERVRLSLEVDGRINFAMQQNDVPVVKAVRIENLSGESIRDLEIAIGAEPAFAETWTTRLAALAPRSIYNVAAVDLQPSPLFLRQLTERMRGRLRVEARHEDAVLASADEPVVLLAWDEWGGLSSLQEILAAFVLPNHPSIETILRSAAELLGGWTGSPALDGYQSKNPQRVYTIAAAIYGALQQLDLTYVNPPASFENEGQRVRLPDQLLDTKLGTCLDVALLAAACLEQSGLHPLMFLVQGHAFTGVWLQEDCFAEPAIDDCVRVRKRIELSEISAFDPTLVTTRPVVPFDRAVAEARRRLDDAATFVAAIDVRRARKGGIRPIPALADRPEYDPKSEEQGTGAPVQPTAPDPSHVTSFPSRSDADPKVNETPETRLDRWRRRLLDLTLRNRLLNFRETKKTVKLLCPDVSRLEDLLADGKTFQILPVPKDLGAADPRDPAAYRRRTGEEGLRELLRDELQNGRLYADCSPEELDRRMTEVYRAARLGLEEGGASALYLGVGFLAWYETDRSEQPRRAPILLLPLELQRRSVREGFSLRRSDEEARINVTLLQMLKQDFGLQISGLDPPPEDESGLDVPLVLHLFRQAVRDIGRWEVVDDAWMGLFSFTKFLMWRDLSERAGDLMKNAVVEHLVKRADQAFDPDAVFPKADHLDDERSPDETFCPLPADSSQLAAVFAAADGRSFVLEGPPGTGKSQTISNLVAHCLAHGKTVLFVSEKMVALNVVYRRLRSVGLGRHCLELHSNKARKREVLAQLEHALQQVESRSPAEWERETERLAGLRNELNAYVRALHRKRATGETVFQATSRLIGLRAHPRVALAWDTPEALDADALLALRDLVDRVAVAGETCGNVAGHAWAETRRADWTPGWEEDVRRAVEELGVATDLLAERARTCAERLGCGEEGWSQDDLNRMHDLSNALIESPAVPAAILTRADWTEAKAAIDTWIQHGRARDRLRASLEPRFEPTLVDLDLDALAARYERASRSWWPLSWWHRRVVRQAFRTVAKDGRPPRKEQLGDILDESRALRDEQAWIDGVSAAARALLGARWSDGGADWEEITAVREWTDRVRGYALAEAGDDFDRGTALRERWARLVSEGRELLERRGRIGSELVAFGEAFSGFAAARARMVELLDLDDARRWGSASDSDLLGRVRTSVERWRSHQQQLRDWCAWRRARDEAVRSNLGPLVDAYERADVEAGRLRPVFEHSYAHWWIGATLDREPVLSRFSSPEHERKIQSFRDADERCMELTKGLVRARLAGQVPATTGNVLSTSEIGVLKREIGKRRRHMPVRKLLEHIPNLLPRLKPCLLMSPLSVAQYLDADFPPFDLVVFDEASQIPVWDAVGAIARGRQAVVVGDPKQLPPTSFFQRTDDDDETVEEAVVEDLESILDDCISARIPWLPLNWHYRSRHESLITFSNYRYYDNRLLTFPSPAMEGMGVSWRHVPGGVYDKGKTRTNRAEAEAVVGEILGRLRDSQRAHQSIGVVTFSQAQQTLIEDLLDEARRKDTDLDARFGEEVDEPLFVKNLENVQGDERDVILFSICYGPDALGRVSMNFGPMNREGGERRLNVAITRARRQVIVFSTLEADQIDLSRTRARGVSDLKLFLEYARRGPSAIAEALETDPDADVDSPFEQAVYDALVRRGWQVHKQVGCARYRIDLAVVDRIAPGRYLLGIECDGANYHRAKTARDRDKLREGVLRGLGWTLHRIWSTDWWTDATREVEKIEAALRDAENAQKIPSADILGGNDASSVADAASAETFAVAPASAPALVPATPPVVADGSAGHLRYRPVELARVSHEQADFYAFSATTRIRDLLLEVVQHEGPVSLELAARRVASCWGFERVRAKALARIRRLVPEEVLLQPTDVGEFLWPPEVAPDEYSDFRVPAADGAGQRPAADLPLEEIANAIVYVLKRNLSAPRADVVREAARLFGIERVGQLVADRFNRAVDTLLARGAVVDGGQALSLRE